MQLSLTIALLGAAQADDRVMVSGNLYTDSMGTLVSTPVLTAAKDVTETVVVSGKASMDVISSASRRIDGLSSASPEMGEETRRAGTLALAYDRGAQRGSMMLERSVEPDYRSSTVGGGLSRDFAQRCTTLDFFWFHSFDRIEPQRLGQSSETQRKDTDSWRFTFAQVLTRGTVLTVSYSPTWVRGYQASGYYSDIVSHAEESPVYITESHPDSRFRQAASVRLDQWVPIRGAFHPFVRLYQDDWGVRSVTAEVSYAQHLGELLIVRLRYRDYTQTASDFYQDSYTVAELRELTHLSLDYKYDALRSQLWGAQAVMDLEPLRLRLNSQRLTRLSAHVAYDYYTQTHDDWSFVAHMGRLGVTSAF
ncbi:MAG: DUF3570 domain-containing protein [Proteobacteria bacterium]|nr:DUF3570 domain-containing protein [Pseudomonadota bacterium]MCP4916142.1 DUF3570 domain-containing protein [Pseudomonadota bacterium]